MRLHLTLHTADELAAALAQMSHGAVLVPSDAACEFDAPVELELTLPDGTTLESHGTVLQVLAGHGVAVTVEPRVVDALRKAGDAKPTARPEDKELSHAQKIQLALHGTRDQRNAILRDKNRALHLYVLKNPQMTVDDVLLIAKSATVGVEMYKQIAERQDWFQRPQIALALARNHKVPGEIAIRALAFIPQDALRQIAKGVGAPPHVITAARKKVIER